MTYPTTNHHGRIPTMSELTGWAQRVTFHEARRHFEDGGAVLVSEDGHREEVPVYTSSTTHTRDTTSWDALAGMVRMWRGRYPGQRYYVVTPLEPEPEIRAADASAPGEMAGQLMIDVGPQDLEMILLDAPAEPARELDQPSLTDLV